MATSSCGSRPCDAVLWCDDDLDIGVDAVVLDTHPCPSSQNAKRGAAGPVDRDRAAVAADSDRARLAALSRTGQLHVHESRFGVTGHRRSIQRPQLARCDVHDRLPVRGRVAYVELVLCHLAQPRRCVLVEHVERSGALVVGDDEQPVTHNHGMHERRDVAG